MVFRNVQTVFKLHLALSVPVTPLPAVVVPLVLEDGDEESGQLGHHLGKGKERDKDRE